MMMMIIIIVIIMVIIIIVIIHIIPLAAAKILREALSNQLCILAS